jgi:hypothetical protein
MSWFYKVLYPPMVITKSKEQRLKYGREFKARFLKKQKTNDIWKDLEGERYQIAFTHGYGYALGFVDFIDQTLTRATYNGPQLPQLFNFSGTGSYLLPFYLDLNDPLIGQIDYICYENSATSSSMPDAWSKFICNLNSNMRSVSFSSPTWLLKRNLSRASKYIDTTQKGIFESLGFKVYLILFEVISNYTVVNGEEMFDPKERYYFIDYEWIQSCPQEFQNMLNYTKLNMASSKCEFRFGLLVLKVTDKELRSL